MYRRDFLVRTGHLVGAAALASALREAHAFAPGQLEPASMSWEEFRARPKPLSSQQRHITLLSILVISR